ncbi:MAG TPA: tRNA 2-thiouridine(34) synthase MnmA [Candidatus Pullilachnospira gallistercoris]|uniref:tRNA-specific 2-thiouridylase MnmA n=1 Tax=Candidatus Pullilachnospira gallistercoris TaxID=2840911 RepID=A0A9D1EBI3_9FIRM|nr:tRNA 2-thiouridine(34) synthase MnmA [Candidatus Pullilachnospira gallistercoris]
MSEKKKIAVGLSGGVDSAVAAYLLKERGYEVIGVTMQTCGADCSSQSVWRRREEAAVGDAAEVARTLGISHVVLDFSGEFRHRVIDYFVEEYLHGRTPNPCNVCNRFVKWEALLRESARLGAGEIATGHYAKIHRLENGRFSVCRSAADAKDQTYALYDLTQEQLARTQMPVGDYTKEEIRKIAGELGLPVAAKKDSQDICFIPDGDYGTFLEREAKDRLPGPGNFVLEDGTVVGRHEGIIHYTIGQRKGLKIALGRPVFVKKIDFARNEVVLSDNAELFTDHLTAEKINPMAVEKFCPSQEFVAKIRYSHRGTRCRISEVSEKGMRIEFEEKVRAVAPGQPVVLYIGDDVAGGGIIAE